MISSLLTAIQFLTVIPFPKSFVAEKKDLERCVPFFPVVGLCIGVVIAAVDYFIGIVLPPFPASVITVIAMTGISGGLHMDGLADTADGFFSSRPREKILEIMRDSRTGVMGVIAVVCVILMKVALLHSLVLPYRFGIIMLMPLAGRCSLVMMMTALPYLRTEGGLATAFSEGKTWLSALWSVLLLAMAGWVAVQWIGIAVCPLSILVTALFSVYCLRKIGGYTGDTLGAMCEIAEIIPVLTAIAMSRMAY